MIEYALQLAYVKVKQQLLDRTSQDKCYKKETP